MPELPEVETVCRGLRPVLEGRVLVRVETRRPDLRRPIPADFAARLTGHRVLAVRRRSKYALIEMAGAPTILLHLGMSGRLVMHLVDEAPPPGKHDHIIFDTDAGMRVVLNDPRRFGLVDFAEDVERHPLLAQVGPEPLGNTFNETYLNDRLKGRRTTMKAALMDQKTVAGLGNIYVCEALFRAGISPRRVAASVPGRRAARLVPEIRAVLNDAIAAGGSSLRDYVQVDGELGYFQHDFRVYGREGEACRKAGCSGTVRRIVQSNRSTFYCPKCQR